EGSNERLVVEADLALTKIDGLLPGWTKPAGKPARANFTFSRDGKSTRFDDLTIDGPGLIAKGSIELDGAGEVVNANFPVLGLSEGDRVSIKAERTSEQVLRVTMRGDIYDARNFVKSSLANLPASKPKQPDMDLDVKLGAVVGHNGEALRGLDFKLSRR